MSTNLAKTLVWKHEYDVKLWRHKDRIPQTNYHHMPLNEPPMKIFCVRHWLGVQKSRSKLDWYMVIYSERLLVRFLLDILKSSLVGLDNSALDFDWYWEMLLDKRCLGNRKSTQQRAGADKGRLKGYIIHPSAVKINCKSSCEAAYANFDQTFFATVRGYQWRFGQGWGSMHDAQEEKVCSIFKERKFARKIYSYQTLPYDIIYRTLQFIVFLTLSNLNKTSKRAVTHASYKMHENRCVLLKSDMHVRPMRFTGFVHSNWQLW